MTSILAYYFAYIIGDIFYTTGARMNIYSYTVTDPTTRQRIPVSHFHVAMYFLQNDLLLSMLMFFAVFIGFILDLFLFYHVYLVSRGTTTSETFKWDDIRYQIKRGRPVVVGVGVADSDDEEEEPVTNETSGKGKKKASEQPAKKAAKKADKQEERVVIDDVKKLKNVYNRGAMGNVMEILRPPKLWK